MVEDRTGSSKVPDSWGRRRNEPKTIENNFTFPPKISLHIYN